MEEAEQQIQIATIATKIRVGFQVTDGPETPVEILGATAVEEEIE